VIQIIIGEKPILTGVKQFLSEVKQFISGVKQRSFGLLFLAIKAKTMAIGTIRAIIMAVYEGAGELPDVFQVFPALIVPFLSCTRAMKRYKWKRLNLMLCKFYIFTKKSYKIVTT
jgi:hypothetical protein